MQHHHVDPARRYRLSIDAVLLEIRALVAQIGAVCDVPWVNECHAKVSYFPSLPSKVDEVEVEKVLAGRRASRDMRLMLLMLLP